MLNVFIRDGCGNGDHVSVEDRALLVNPLPSPPLLPQKIQVFSQFFTADGASTGSNDMGISGAVTSQDFYIPASSTNDRYITEISFVMGYGGAAQMYEFADTSSALTNGVKFYYQRKTGQEIQIFNFKKNLDFLRASGSPTSNNNWESRGFQTLNDYGYFVTIALDRILPPFGLKLDRGSSQRAVITIRDDCTAADLFNCEAVGFERFE